MDAWQLILTREVPGLVNMQTDLRLFNELEAGQIPSTLRLYSWRPNCISLGYSQKIVEEIDVRKAAKLGWDVVQRPTGGGIVFHNEAEVTYSLVTDIDNPKLPKGLVPAYKKISEAIVCALKTVGVTAKIARTQNTEHGTRNTGLCFEYPAEYEIVSNNQKIVGSAQKRGKKALLQQGSIFVRDTKKELFSVLRNPYNEQMAVSVEDVLGREVGFAELSKALISGFEEGLGVKFKIQK
ncbi:biotin/lipoate A/B protein ligase family protein [Candidatus Margulisiibacteriota bacterium]